MRRKLCMNGNSATGNFRKVNNASKADCFTLAIYTFIVVPRAVTHNFICSQKRIQLSYEFNCCAFPSIIKNCRLNFKVIYAAKTLTIFMNQPPLWPSNSFNFISLRNKIDSISTPDDAAMS